MSYADDIARELEGAGLEPGTPEFETELRARKVQLCRDLKHVTHCSSCVAYDACSLIKLHLSDIAAAQARAARRKEG